MDNTNILLLDRFMRGETSPEEEQQLLLWFRDVDAQEDILTFYRQHWHEASDKELSEDVQLRMFHQLKTKIRSESIAIKKTRKFEKRWFIRWGQYAAAIILCVVVGITSHLYTRQSVPVAKEYQVEAEKGQRASVMLPDGTKVWLNSHTQISYNSNYGMKDRIVALVGEAYFEVAKDKDHRFIVKTGEMEVEALGTSFNVKAYKEDRDVIATLFTGSIRATAGSHSVVLSPDQQVCFNRIEDDLKVDSPENVAYASMWRDNELAFKGETLNDIAIRLNRLYNVHIEFKSEKIKQFRFSGVIKNNSLDNVFEIISLTSPIMYESLGDTIVLSERQ